MDSTGLRPPPCVQLTCRAERDGGHHTTKLRRTVPVDTTLDDVAQLVHSALRRDTPAGRRGRGTGERRWELAGDGEPLAAGGTQECSCLLCAQHLEDSYVAAGSLAGTSAHLHLDVDGQTHRCTITFTADRGTAELDAARDDDAQRTEIAAYARRCCTQLLRGPRDLDEIVAVLAENADRLGSGATGVRPDPATLHAVVATLTTAGEPRIEQVWTAAHQLGALWADSDRRLLVQELLGAYRWTWLRSQAQGATTSTPADDTVAAHVHAAALRGGAADEVLARHSDTEVVTALGALLRGVAEADEARWTTSTLDLMRSWQRN